MEVKRRPTDAPIRAGIVPGPQPNSATLHKTSAKAATTLDSTPQSRQKPVNPWSDLAWRVFGTVLAIAFAVRLYRLGSPAQVVFDEVHFGGFASHYLKQEYFFDVHPPLGKMLIAAIGYVAGFDGSFRFDKIGLDYSTGSAPFRFMRLIMVLFGTGSIAFSMASLIEMGISPLAAGFAGILMAFDNALTVQTKFILLDSMLFFFIFASIYAWIKFRQQRHQPFTAEWWGYMAATGAAIACATGVKMVGLFTVATIGVATIIDLWDLADHKRNYSNGLLFKHFLSRAAGLAVLPVCLYMSFFYVHFAVLSKTGPGDAFMSAEFQSTLEGNGMNINSRSTTLILHNNITSQIAVYFGQQVKIKNKEEDIWLHSNEQRYPLHHDDGKVSSNGQLVSGNADSDGELNPNNVWIFYPSDSEPVGRVPLKNGDVVRVFHPATGKFLATHDVASPLTMTNQEVTMHEWSDEKQRPNMMWTVHVTQNTSGAGALMKSMSTQFKFIHVPTKVHLNNHQLNLPQWGAEHREINGCKRGHKESSKWTVSTILDQMTKEEEQEKANKKTPKVSFMEKFTELQSLMVSSNAKLSDDHPFKSSPGSWPFVIRGIAFWDRAKQARIYLLGNVVSWMTALFATIALACSLGKEAFLWRRGQSPRAEQLTFRYLKQGGFLLLAYGLHYFPFFTMSRSLYLHHYLPSFMLSCMATAVLFDHGLRDTKHARGSATTAWILKALALILTVACLFVFKHYAPITYGLDMASDELNKRKWVSTWDWS